MKRRSFISLAGIAPLLRMPLWNESQVGQHIDQNTQKWGPPSLIAARPEYGRVVLSFTSVEGAESYTVRIQPKAGPTAAIEGVLATNYSVQGLQNEIQHSFTVAAVGPQGTTAFSNEMAATPTEEADWATLAEAFQGSNPMRTSCPFWMVHGNESEDELRQFMEVIYRFGFEGVTLHPYDYQGFLEENNWRQWRIIVSQAKKLGLTVWEQDDKDYPCGYAAGKVVAANRNFARWEVTLAHRESRQGPATLSLNVATLLPAKQRLAAVVAAGPGNRFEDLTDQVAGGELQWKVPEGKWKIFLHGAWQPGIDDPKVYPDLVRGEIRGYIDPLSEEATGLYVKLVLEDTCRAIGDGEVGRTWKGFYIDEPGFYSSGTTLGTAGEGTADPVSAGLGYPYTPDLFARFEARYGYSLREFLPLLWIKQGPKTIQVRHDYMDFVSSEYARLFIGCQTRFCQAHGLQINGHVREDLPYQLGGGTGSNFRTLEAFSMGGFDHIFDQWYEPDEDVYWRQAKMASSISHYGQTPMDEAMVEHFAATGWRTGLTEMKVMMDWTTTRGLSRIVPCGLDTEDPPVWEDAPEFWLHAKNPLAQYFPAYQTVVNRGTMLIRGGRHVAKGILLDTAESAWVGEAEPVWRSTKALSQAHFDYDMVSYGVFANPDRTRIVGSQIRLGREDYEFVFLPGVDAIPVEVLRRLLEFYEAGGAVICLGPGQRLESDPNFKHVEYAPHLPVRSAGGRHEEEVKDLVARIWGERASGRGRAHLVTYKDTTSFLYSLNAHDVWIDPNLTMLQYYHRRLSGREVYFFNNEGAPVSTTVCLRSVQGTPEIWDLVRGSIGSAPFYSHQDDGVRLRLQLARYESVFVILNPSVRSQPHVVACDADEVVRGDSGQILLRKYTPGHVRYAVAGAADVVEEKEVATPSRPLTVMPLQQGWSRSPIDPNGAIYSCAFDWPAQAPLTAALIIEEMTQVIGVTLNGKDLGQRFTYPFRFELGSALRAGPNQLELRHVERYTFTSRLGKVRVAPYYELHVDHV